MWNSPNFKIVQTKVCYWSKHEIKTEQKRRKKLDDKYIQKIYNLAKDKTTSEMGSKRIAAIINKDLENEVADSEKRKKVHFSTICRYLNQYFGKPRKIRKTFFYQRNKKRRGWISVKWC